MNEKNNNRWHSGDPVALGGDRRARGWFKGSSWGASSSRSGEDRRAHRFKGSSGEQGKLVTLGEWKRGKRRCHQFTEEKN